MLTFTSKVEGKSPGYAISMLTFCSSLLAGRAEDIHQETEEAKANHYGGSDNPWEKDSLALNPTYKLFKNSKYSNQSVWAQALHKNPQPYKEYESRE